jgi:hypothetical protein
MSNWPSGDQQYDVSTALWLSYPYSALLRVGLDQALACTTAWGLTQTFLR